MIFGVHLVVEIVEKSRKLLSIFYTHFGALHVNASPIATLRNVIDSTLPQDMKPELEAPIMVEEFKSAIERGALKQWPEKDGIYRILYSLLGYHQKRPIANI